MTLCGAAALLMLAATASTVQAAPGGRTLAVVMTNDAKSNQIRVYDARTNVLVQTLSTRGQGGVGGNARGVAQYNGELFAAVNNGSGTVALFRRVGDGLKFENLVTTTSAPVSIDFGNDHMYVAGTTTVDSFVLHHDNVGSLDGTSLLELAGGGAPPAGSTAQVGALDAQHLLVTLKTDPDPGTVDIVALHDGAITGAAPATVSAPAGSLTPFGFAVYPDGTALITLAHSSELGLFRDGAFGSVIAEGQAAPCWATRIGKYVFTANTGSGTISRLVATGNNIFVDSLVAAPVPTGAPSDIDARAGILGVIDHGAGASHLTLFTVNEFGELTASGSPINIGAPAANGVAIIPSAKRDDR
jgi:DNA-binding beta-propeller fold protein YncE